jgi:hypothetical protein
MAKQYKVKDLNNNGKIDGWEQGKYDAINKNKVNMGYKMNMGHKSDAKSNNINFSDKDAMNMAKSYVANFGKSTKNGNGKKNENLSEFETKKKELQGIQQNVTNQLYNLIERDSAYASLGSSGAAKQYEGFNVLRNPDSPLQNPIVQLPSMQRDNPYSERISSEYEKILKEAGMDVRGKLSDKFRFQGDN